MAEACGFGILLADVLVPASDVAREGGAPALVQFTRRAPSGDP